MDWVQSINDLVFIHMGRKSEIDANTIKNILNDSFELSIRKLSKKYNLNKNTIIRIIKESETKKNNVEYYKCKKTQKIFYDTKNKSGIITRHLSSIYGDFNLNEINSYFDIKYSNDNVITFTNYIKSLRIVFNKGELISGLHKYEFKTKNIYIFFIENIKISSNKKIKPIFLYKLKDRYVNSIFIYEDEWKYSKDIVELKVKTLLNINNSKRIFAKNCNISIISKNQKKLFLDNNHIQGSCNSTLNYGAFYLDELVAVMTFTTHRNMTNDTIKFDYELNRYATNIKYIVVGASSKIFKAFLKTLDGHGIIVSYGDRRWVKTHKKNLYTMLNFSLNQISKHDYSYIMLNTIKRTHKITMENRIKNNKINERELLGYRKIWDCGKYRYTYKY